MAIAEDLSENGSSIFNILRVSELGSQKDPRVLLMRAAVGHLRSSWKLLQSGMMHHLQSELHSTA